MPKLNMQKMLMFINRHGNLLSKLLRFSIKSFYLGKPIAYLSKALLK